MKNAGHSTLESMGQALWYNRWTMNKFSQYLSGDILEVGCGIGNFTKDLSTYGNVWAIDIDSVGLSLTKKHKSKNIQVGFGDIEKGKYFFGKRKFQTLVCLNVLEHIKHDDQAIKNMYSLLSPGGHLILLVPIHPELYGSIDKAIFHFRRYVPTAIVSTLEKAKFKIISSRKLNFIGALGWWFSGRILGRDSVSKRRIALFNSVAPWVLPIEDIVEPPIGTSILVIAKR